MSFKCSRCGACCRNLAGATPYQELDRGDGVCKYLENNLCTIYENRPLICRVDDGYNKLFSNLISKDEYYKLNYQVCETLQKKGE